MCTGLLFSTGAPPPIWVLLLTVPVAAIAGDELGYVRYFLGQVGVIRTNIEFVLIAILGLSVLLVLGELLRGRHRRAGSRPADRA